MSNTFDSMDTLEDYARVCYYGKPGSGKTTDAATLAKLGRTLIYPFEPGLKKVALAQHDIPTSNLYVRQVLRETEKEFWAVKKKLDEDPDFFVGAVLDTMTTWTDRIRKEYLRETYETGVAKAEARGEDYDKPKNWMPREVYGELADDIAPLIVQYSDLPMHVAWTAHIRRDVDEDDGEVTYGPATTPAVQKTLTAYADILMLTRRVGRYDDGRPVLIGTTADMPKYDVKDRLGILPSPHMVYPTMERIVAYLRGDLSESTDPLQQEFEKWSANRAEKAQKKED